MGYNTDLIGHFTVEPHLNAAEVEWLIAYADTRRWDRPAGPYVVLDNPAVREEYDEIQAFNRPAPGEPGLNCDWVPCPDGDCIAFDGREKFYEPGAWLAYLIDHFLRPGAVASTSGDRGFAGFTFDHHVNGIVAAHRADTRRLWLIEVIDNEVAERTLVQGEDEAMVWGLLPYEKRAGAERDGQSRRRRRRST